jgi:hypothetical protein
LQHGSNQSPNESHLLVVVIVVVLLLLCVSQKHPLKLGLCYIGFDSSNIMPNISVFCINFLKNNKGPKTYENYLVTGNIKYFSSIIER